MFDKLEKYILAKVQEVLDKKINSMQEYLNSQINQLENIQRSNFNSLCEIINSKYKRMESSIWGVKCHPGSSITETKVQFFKNYKKADGILADIQKINLYMMTELQNICDSIGVTFWLHAGTLIGALRHNGFIPWDDDVDLALMHEDFEKLCHFLKTSDSIFTLNEYYSDIYGTKSVQIRMKNGLPNIIDIVCYDWVECSNFNQKERILENIRHISSTMYSHFQKDLKNPKVNDIGLYHCGPYNHEDQIKVDNNISQHRSLYATSKKEACCYSIQNYPFPYPIMLIDEMFPLVPCEFEGKSFLIPRKAEYYLDGYGDIWSIPSDIDKCNHIYAYAEKFSEIREFTQKINI